MFNLGMDKDLERVLTSIYSEQYLIDTRYYLNDSNYLVYSAKLNCSYGSKAVYLKLEKKIDPFTGRVMIGNGFTINGLPVANDLDAKPEINIEAFGKCSLSSLGTSCRKLRNLESSWITSSNNIDVGSGKGITKSSVLHCHPASSNENIVGTGVISAEDSGQMNLYQALENYRVDYNAMLQNSIVTHAGAPLNANGISNINVDVMTYIGMHGDEFLYLYELYYPDRKMLFDEFSEEPDAGKYAKYAKMIRFMTYMLPKDEHVKKILDIMIPGKCYLKLNSLSATDPNYKAFFKPGFWGTGKIVVNNIEQARDYVIPFKTFFHESGHAVDFFAGVGNKYLSTYFQYSSYAFEAKTKLSGSTIVIDYDSKGKQAKTIHEWAENDVRTVLYQVGIDFLNNPANLQSFQLTNLDKQTYLKRVIEDYFLSGIGEAKYNSIKNSKLTDLQVITEIYNGIQTEMKNRLVDQDGICNLAKDIYGGITGNQVGGGHGYEYWFYEKNDLEVKLCIKEEGDRKKKIEKEAFAGYFEYRVMNISAGIDPAKKVLPKTIQALEKMMERI